MITNKNFTFIKSQAKIFKKNYNNYKSKMIISKIWNIGIIEMGIIIILFEQYK